MGAYQYNGVFNASKLEEEIGSSEIAASYLGFVYLGGALTINTSGELDASGEDALDALVATHDPADASLDQIMEAAISFGVDLMRRWGVAIMGSGLIGSGLEHEVAVALTTATVLSQTGNLFALEVELGSVTPITTYLEVSRLTEIRNEIRTYLGMQTL